MFNTMEITSSLAPLTVVFIWSVFMFTKNVMVKLIALLMSSLALPLVYMDIHKTFWPCGLMLILMSTGLIVVFAYVVSLQEGGGKFVLKYSLIPLLVTFVLMFYNKSELFTFKHLNLQVVMSCELSILLIMILLFIVVTFVRLVYSKGGGFRKKF